MSVSVGGEVRVEAVGRDGGLAETSLILLALGMEGRATGQGRRAASGSCKRSGGRFSPDPPEGTQTAHLVLAQGDPLATSCRQNYERIRLCCSSCELCYSSKRKPVQQGGGSLPGRSSGLGGAGAFPPRSRELLGPLPGERGRTDPCPAQLLMQLRGQPRLFPVPPFLVRGSPRLRSAADSSCGCGASRWAPGE